MRRVLGRPGGALVSVAAMISIFAALNGSIFRARACLSPWPATDIFSGRSAACTRVPHASAAHRAAGRVVLPDPAERAIRTALHAGDFPELDFVRNDRRGGDRVARKAAGFDRPYRVLGYPVVPILFVLVAIALLYSTFVSSPRESGIGLVLIVAGLPFYFYWKGRMMAGKQDGYIALRGNPDRSVKKGMRFRNFVLKSEQNS